MLEAALELAAALAVVFQAPVQGRPVYTVQLRRDGEVALRIRQERAGEVELLGGQLGLAAEPAVLPVNRLR